ncbi:3-dehydroquinate synthase [Buchnera aphidicola (Pemphigus obesinymphae)]|uniref:3-dehydroquinate synthase n=1 Tax=Buchnera aphidicola TaxID=9 RepID=UPI002237C631|nr:3-dehydroquinate synthase [Buchnera aphidicola]MCW5196434.1 3-dehydroquinate synthase [Buchnera aphidicola (Pemphigus obesinymphae)]
MEKLNVDLGKRSYTISIGSNLLEEKNIFYPLELGNKAMLVTNKTLANIWKDHVLRCLTEKGIEVDQVILSDGEKYKNLREMEFIISSLLENTHGRDTTLIGLGGGVIGDITGFSAAIYQRGVRYIQIPTTLLSQVDASVGGKTAVNHILGKNMIGVFWQPASVVIDIQFLHTLPKRELVSGIAEIVKYAIIFDSDFFIWLEKNIDGLLNLDIKLMKHCISTCCKFKLRLVELDEKESDSRVLLNLGHTYGHAIESHVGYGNWLHGEAVSAGIIMAARTSEKIGILKHKDVKRIEKLMIRVGLPIKGPKNMLPSSYFPYFMRDKKVISGVIRMILPVKIGEAKVFTGIDENIIKSVITDCIQNN